jgi:outer membrane protein
MNKFFMTVCAAVLLTSYAQAQTSSGSMMVGGSLNYTSGSSQSGSYNYNDLVFSPHFGYFVADNFVVGTSLTIETGRNGTGSNKTVNSGFGFGPFARYYKFTSNDKFAFFGEAGIDFVSAKTDPPTGAVRKSNSFRFSISPGAAYFINQHWAFELSILGLAIQSTDPNTSNDNDKENSVQFGLSSFSPSLGFHYHF